MTNSNPAHKTAILREAREAQGISLEVVHEATKIPMDALRAIEEGYNVRILSPFYYRAFMKKYAQFLGISAENILDEPQDFRKENKVPKRTIVPPATPPFVRKSIIEPPAIQGKSSSSDLKQKLSVWLTRRRQQQIVGAIGICLALFVFIKVFGFVMNIFVPRGPRPAVTKPKENRKVKNIILNPKKALVTPKPASKSVTTAPKTAVVPSPETKSAQQPQANAEEKSAPVSLAESAAPAGPINLTVRAKRNSWLQVRSDGIVVFQSTLNKGDVENWAADKKIEISGKNVNDLEFELNGKLISSLGKSDRQARRLIVTKDGLSIKD